MKSIEKHMCEDKDDKKRRTISKLCSTEESFMR